MSLQKEPYSDVRPDDWGLYSTIDEEAPESEVMALIKALVYALKPKVVVETGTALGYSAEMIGKTLMFNGNDGVLYTFEVDYAKACEAELRTSLYRVHVHNRPARSIDPMKFAPIDLIFIDAVLEHRHLEYLHWEAALRPGGIAILHDTMKFDPPKTEVQQLPGEKIWLPTPRGVTLIQKPAER